MHYKLNDWRILPDNEQSILEALAHQPVIVNIPITTALTTYKEGLLDICQSVKDDDVSSAINSHSVLLIGWGIFQSNYGDFKYWIIKNRCGSEWGMNGYCNIVMNSDAPRLYEAIHGQLSVEEKQDYGVCYGPLVPLTMKSRYQGQYTEQLNWVTEGYVPKEVGNQGDCASCWIWSSVKGFDAVSAISKPNNIRPQYSVQEVLNNIFPRERGCRSGPPLCALEYLRQHGTCLEMDCPYTDIKQGGQSFSGMHYKLDDWRMLPDNEQSILEVLAHQPVIVNIRITSALTTYKEASMKH